MQLPCTVIWLQGERFHRSQKTTVTDGNEHGHICLIQCKSCCNEGKNNRSSERRSLQRELLPLPSAEQFPRSLEVTFLLQEKLTTTDRVACPTHMSSFVPEPFEIQDQPGQVRETGPQHEAKWRTRPLHRCNGSAYATANATVVKNLFGDETASDVAGAC